MPGLRHPLSLAIALNVLPLSLSAQPLNLEETLINSSPLDLSAGEMTTPVGVLEGEALIRRREASIGETLGLAW